MDKPNKQVIKFNSIQVVSTLEKYTPTSFHSHWHNALEFTVILKDGCVYTVNDCSYTLNAGDVLLVWPRELHEVIDVPKEGSFFIQFSSNLLENNGDLMTLSQFLGEYHVISAKEEPKLAAYVRERIYELRNLYFSSDYFTETKCKIEVYNMLLAISEYILGEKREYIENKNISHSTWQYVHQACAYITAHATENITQSGVAKTIGLSTYYFSKIFKECMQMSFPAYLSNVRVRNATNLLANEELSITECAFQSGFQSTSAFNKLFHDYMGCSPRDYRSMYHKRA